MSSIHGTVVLLVGLALVGCDGNFSSPAGPAERLRDVRSPNEITLEIMGVPRPTPIRPIIPSVEVTQRSASDVTQPSATLAADVKQSVTGHYQFVGINTGNDFKYSVAAIRHDDGSVSGEFEERVILNSTGEFIRQTHGTVTCFEIVGNMSRIGGLVDQATDPRFLPGTEFRLVVVDNGNGASDPPDLGSNARFGFPGTAQAFCNAGTAFNLEPVEHGNVEVRP
jgi:hypothetical protein